MSSLFDQLTQRLDGYDALPEAIKATISRKEWLFMTDSHKAELLRAETEPEV